MSTANLRPDLAAIAAMIRPGARVLDVGCGDGALLEHLKAKNVDGRGIEISQANVNACVARGLAVVQGDADTDLVDYPAQVFDAVILSQTIQATEKPRVVMEHLLRIGRRVAISLPNFGYWKVRLSLLTGGRMPRTPALDYSWWQRHHRRGPCPERQWHHLADEAGKPHPWLSGPQPVCPGRGVFVEEDLGSRLTDIVMAHRSVGHPVGFSKFLKMKHRRHLDGPQLRAMTP
jgi:methionine biosynthesis protein MetW